MKFYSEKTDQFYETAEDCEKAEAEFVKTLSEAEAREKALKAERKARAEEISDAYKAVKEAEKKYTKLRNQFIKDYGSYHMTFTEFCDPFDTLSIPMFF